MLHQNKLFCGIMPPLYQDVPVWRTHGRYRNQMKRHFPKPLYNQRSKDGTIFSVNKRPFDEYLKSGTRQDTEQGDGISLHRL